MCKNDDDDDDDDNDGFILPLLKLLLHLMHSEYVHVFHILFQTETARCCGYGKTSKVRITHISVVIIIIIC